MSGPIPMYSSVGCNDADRAVAFYTDLLGSIGLHKMVDNPTGGAFFGTPFTGMFAVVKPFDGKPATVGNGTMIGFAMPSKEAVDAFYHKAISLGGTDEGKPGDRGGGSYFGYFRDPEGNKLCGFHIEMPAAS